ncbi:MAG: hypothetical protein E7390_05355 [Ruminococcaceae bacterium]|nr:hypothetical protein [Oscillospiraceae bacterium]
MNKYERLAEKFAGREKIIGTMMSSDSTLMLEALNREELDFILFDAEHGIFDTQNVVPMLQITRLMGLPAFVRAQDSAYHLIAKAIDMGADGVMIPRVESCEQLRTTVDGMLFAPAGRKGCGGHGQMRKGEKYSDFAKTRFLLPQIESPKGIAALPEMLDSYGEYISAVIIGPYDLSIMVGTPLDITSPKMMEAIQSVFDICNAHGKSCGIFCDDAEFAAKYRKMGCNVLWSGCEKSFLMRGYAEEMDALLAIE